MMDADEFKSRVLPISSKIHRYASQMTKNSHDAEDVVQEIFLKLWRNRDGMSEIKNFEAFVFRMTRNLCLDKIKAKRPHYYDDRREESYGMESVEPEPDPERRMELSDTVSRIKTIIEGLPENQRTAVHLRDMEGYSYEEISEIMSMEVNAVRVNISRGRKKIREIISVLHK